MDLPQSPDGVLAQPTRARLFALLGELRRAAGTDELAGRLGLHPNGVRLHLERLHEAGLVDRDRERIARGRPRDRWAVSPDAAPGGDPPAAYAELSRWLARAVGDAGTGPADAVATGRQIGREIAPGPGPESAERRFRTALTAMGFRPRPVPAAPGHVGYCLDNCPYRDAVTGAERIVCALHEGITAGLLDVIDPDGTLDAFWPADPRTAGCGIEIRGLVDAPSTTGDAPAECAR
ncbi:MAG: helix-turn-helix transcriptional regulator [Solirubrobacteraceae bacterium]